MRYVDLSKTKRSAGGGIAKKLVLFLTFLFLVPVLPFFGLFLWKGDVLGAFFTPLSYFYRITDRGELEQDRGRVNGLILGIDSRGKAGGSQNTDTIIFSSFSLEDGSADLISVPRDLWISGDGINGRVNSLYSIGGMGLAKDTISKVLGVPVHYYVLVDFKAFEELIDAVEGVDIYVERSFTDYLYPVSGMEDAYPIYKRWETVSFEQGLQHMGGEQALKYARSRHALGPEGSDFARAKRQQKVITAVKDKALSPAVLLNPARVIDLYNRFNKAVETNISLAEIQRFLELARKFSDVGVRSYVLEPEQEGLLYVGDPNLYGGAYALVPRAGDFSEIHAWVKSLLFGAVSKVE